jgi:glycosyltransferase involved in cell wall biosynthesis
MEVYMNKISIVSNLSITIRLPKKIEKIDNYKVNVNNKTNILQIISILNFIRKYHVCIVFNANAFEMLLAFLNKFIFLSKTKIVFYDLNLHKPKTIKARFFCKIKNVFLYGVDRFFVMHKDMSFYGKFYNVPENKCIYIPFKPNNYNVLERYEIVDGDYLLSCGASYRDFDTLIKALEFLEYPTKIVLPEKNIEKIHNTELNESELPSYIEVVRHDFDYDSWNNFIAKSKFVVIPIKKDALQPAGISVYLEAMALGKAVIVSEGASTNSILSCTDAEIVTCEDPEKLALAIKKMWEDKDYREKISKNGHKYAISLQGEERLVGDILEELCILCE